MAKPKPRVRIPKKASVGDVVVIKTLISHPMESGRRKDKQGNLIPRKIINKFVARFDGTEVFSADLHPSISANPYLSFNLKVEKAGTLEFEWTDDDGSVFTHSGELKVS